MAGQRDEIGDQRRIEGRPGVEGEAAVGGEGVAVRARLVGRRQTLGSAGAIESRAEEKSLRGVVG